MPKKIISGGQTGIDRGALDACLEDSYPCGGWCPNNRRAEDGIIDQKYPLQETHEIHYEARTRLNVINSDGTLIISPGHLFGGTFLTKQIASEADKPVFVVSVFDNTIHNLTEEIFDWVKAYNINTLNIAGPRKSQWLTGYEIAFLITEKLIDKLKN